LKIGPPKRLTRRLSTSTSSKIAFSTSPQLQRRAAAEDGVLQACGPKRMVAAERVERRLPLLRTAVARDALEDDRRDDAEDRVAVHEPASSLVESLGG
jgi:hypothetical protein